jgi:hypothetical protein
MCCEGHALRLQQVYPKSTIWLPNTKELQRLRPWRASQSPKLSFDGRFDDKKWYMVLPLQLREDV